ncbi:MAG: hypothetical protein ACR2QL_00640 [Woeseiaceae bacterium]
MKDGSTEAAEIEWWVDEIRQLGQPKSTVKVTVGSRSREKSGFDFFEAFQKARKPFESDGFRFLCYGASLKVWPSGMARDMGGGMKAYRLYEDRRPSMDDLVQIFASGEGVIPSTVEEQTSYAEAWFEKATGRSLNGSKKKWWKFW